MYFIIYRSDDSPHFLGPMDYNEMMRTENELEGIKFVKNRDFISTDMRECEPNTGIIIKGVIQ